MYNFFSSKLGIVFAYHSCTIKGANMDNNFEYSYYSDPVGKYCFSSGDDQEVESVYDQNVIDRMNDISDFVYYLVKQDPNISYNDTAQRLTKVGLHPDSIFVKPVLAAYSLQRSKLPN